MLASNWFAQLLSYFLLLLFVKSSFGLTDKETIAYPIDFDTYLDTLAFVHIQVTGS